MRIEFTKMHGIGNDYIYIDCTERMIPDPAGLSRAMSPRHTAVGSDGLVLICKSDIADFKMRMFNADGSEAGMCGNAIRCIGKYVYEHHLTGKTTLSIETLSGIKKLWLFEKNGAVQKVRADLGYASFEPDMIPLRADKPFITHPVEIEGANYDITCVSTGCPHAVILTGDIQNTPVEKIGRAIENHLLFPGGMNTDFIHVSDRQSIEMRVWERGTGETWACGTGACAAVAACVKLGLCDAGKSVTVSLTGGKLEIVCEDDYHAFMTGAAQTVYTGIYDYQP